MAPHVLSPSCPPTATNIGHCKVREKQIHSPLRALLSTDRNSLLNCPTCAKPLSRRSPHYRTNYCQTQIG